MNTAIKKPLYAITGGIGVGKSMIARIFEKMGIPVYYADQRAKYLINTDPEIREKIIDLLGQASYTPKGYQNGWVSEQIFKDKSLLRQLNEIVHPKVREDTVTWVSKQQNVPFLLYEAALMKEKDPRFSKIILVTSPKDLRIKRIKARDPQRSLEQILGIMASQNSEEEWKKLADFVIINDEKSLLIPQIMKFFEGVAG